MNLGQLITALETADPDQTVGQGFANPHSYRGDYMDLAFEPATDTTVGAMLAAARSAVGATFQGWKGGDFLMDADTWCWLSAQGDASCETISPQMVTWMLRPASAGQPATDRTETELTAEDARDLADDLGLQLYRAQDALAWVEECCVIADREQRPVTTADVREWLQGPRCGRQLAADATDRAALRDQIAETLTAAAFECDGKCGLSEQDCYDAHPISFSAMSNGITHVTGSVIAIADAVLSVLPAPTDQTAPLSEVDEDKPYPDYREWLVEMQLGDGTWGTQRVGPDREKARALLRTRQSQSPEQPCRLVRLTTIHAIEADEAERPAAVSQPDGEARP